MHTILLNFNIYPMNLSNLKPAKGAVRTNKRLGRGQGSGKGGTSGKGHKGHQARSGCTPPTGFEGGQMPLQRRIPKFGFKNRNKIYYKVINLDVLQSLAEKEKITSFDFEVFRSNGLISKKSDKVKILGGGELKSKLTIKAHAFSSSAQKTIESKGGTISKL